MNSLGLSQRAETRFRKTVSIELERVEANLQKDQFSLELIQFVLKRSKGLKSLKVMKLLLLLLLMSLLLLLMLMSSLLLMLSSSLLMLLMMTTTTMALGKS